LRQLLYQDVADMFYQTLAEERQLRIAGENVETLQRRVQELERRVELGKSRPAEQLQARADWLDSRAQREELVGALTASRELLAFLTRVPADRLKLRDDSPLPEPGVLRDWIQHAMGRPDLQAARDNERASQKAIDATVAEYSPTVSVSGSYTPYADPKAERDWSAMLTVDMPIFEGHITAARIKERKAQLRQRQLDLAMLERSSMKEVRAAHARFISAAAELERLREFEAVAIENMEAQKADYERGAASNLDYLTAVNRMHQAKIRLAGGESRARTLWARLICAAGETPAVQEIP
jgi:outer membrane protein